MSTNENNESSEKNSLISGNHSSIGINKLDHNIDNRRFSDSHNVVNNSTVNQNHTIVYEGHAAAEKLLSERCEEYRAFCRHVMNSDVIDRATRLRLNEKASMLSLSEDTAAKIEATVAATKQMTELSNTDRVTISLAKKAIAENDVTALLPKIIALANKTDNNEVQYLANLMLAVEDPAKCIARYERAEFDNYWQTFWTYLAYIRQNNSYKAEETFHKLDGWHNMPEDHLLLLNGAGCLVQYFTGNGSDSLRNTAMGYLQQYNSGDSCLDGFVRALQAIIGCTRPLSFGPNPAINFYMRLFGAKKSAASRPVFTPPVTTNNNVAPRQAPASARPAATTNPRPDKSGNFIKYLVIAGIAIAGALLFWPSGEKKNQENPEISSTEPAQTETAAMPSGKQNTKSSGNVAKQESGTYNSAKVTEKRKESASVSTNQNKQTKSDKSDSYASAKTDNQPVIEPYVERTPAEKVAEAKKLIKRYKPESAFPLLTEAAKSGNMEAYYLLAEMYYSGDGTKKNFDYAFELCSKAANAGNADAQFLLGMMYRLGRGTAKNIEKAKDWWSKAAAQGNEKAQLELKKL